MSPPVPIELPADHRQLVLHILAAHLPRGTKVWVFGSRATGRARRYSDLDLASDAGRQLTLDEFAELTAAICPTRSILPTGVISTFAGGRPFWPSVWP
jgi:hypothetical protein